MAIDQLKKGAVLSYVIIFLNIVVGLAYTPFMLRMMGQSEYGLYSLISSVITYLTILDLGFGSAIIRYTASFRAQRKQDEQYAMFGLFVRLYTVMGIVAFLLGLSLYFNIDSIFSHSMSDDELRKAQIMMLLLSFNLAVTFPLSIFGSIVTAYEDFVFQKVVQIIRIMISTVTMIVLLEFGYKAIGLVVVTTVFNILSLLINFWYCKYRIRVKIHFQRINWRFLKEISSYSFYIFLNAIMDRLFWSTGQFIIGAIAGTAAVAVYSVAITLEMMFMTFSTAITNVLLPRVTKMVTNREGDKVISDLFIRTGRVQYVVIGFILISFIVFGVPFIRVWAGTDYSDSYLITLIFFLATTIPLIQNVGITILQARNQLRFRSVVLVTLALICVGISIPLTYAYGVLGCAAGTAIALVLGQGVTMNLYYWKRQRIAIGRFWKEIIKMSMAPVLIGCCAFPVVNYYLDINSMSTLIYLAVPFIILYVIIVYLFVLDDYEKSMFGRMVSVFLAKCKILSSLGNQTKS